MDEGRLYLVVKRAAMRRRTFCFSRTYALSVIFCLTGGNEMRSERNAMSLFFKTAVTCRDCPWLRSCLCGASNNWAGNSNIDGEKKKRKKRKKRAIKDGGRLISVQGKKAMCAKD